MRQLRQAPTPKPFRPVAVRSPVSADRRCRGPRRWHPKACEMVPLSRMPESPVTTLCVSMGCWISAGPAVERVHGAATSRPTDCGATASGCRQFTGIPCFRRGAALLHILHCSRHRVRFLADLLLSAFIMPFRGVLVIGRLPADARNPFAFFVCAVVTLGRPSCVASVPSPALARLVERVPRRASSRRTGHGATASRHGQASGVAFALAPFGCPSRATSATASDVGGAYR